MEIEPKINSNFANFSFRCQLIALGNGTACRETESWITDMMQKKILDSNSIRYCIVSECGASIYSCSDVAKSEFPNLDVNLISAGERFPIHKQIMQF